MKDGKLSIAPVRAEESTAAKALATRIDGLMPRVRITELLYEVARSTHFPEAFRNVRTGEAHDNENALLAAILADGSNLGLTRMAEASQGVSPDQLVWTKASYIAPDNYKAGLARIIDAHHALPIAGAWGQGTTSASDGQFFRSGKRGSGAGDFNAKYGVDPGFSFYTHVSDQHGPHHVTVISAATHEAPYVLDSLLHHGTALEIDTHYTDTGGATDHVFALCRMLGFRFCPRLRDFPDRRMACIEAPGHYATLKPLMGGRVKVDVIREHWDDIIRLVATLKAGTVLPSAMLRKLAAYERQNQLDLALREVGRVERTLFMLDWARKPVATPPLSGGPEQVRAAALSHPGHLHIQAGPHCRPHARSTAVSRVGPEPRHRRDRLLELDLHRRCRQSSPVDRRTGARRAACPHVAGGLGTYRLLRRLSVGPRSRDALGSAPAQSWANEHGSMSRTMLPDRSRLAQFSEHLMR